MPAKAKNKPSPALRRALGRIARLDEDLQALNSALASSEQSRQHETARLVELREQLVTIDEALKSCGFGPDVNGQPPVAMRVERLALRVMVQAREIGIMRDEAELISRRKEPAHWQLSPEADRMCGFELRGHEASPARFMREVGR